MSKFENKGNKVEVNKIIQSIWKLQDIVLDARRDGNFETVLDVLKDLNKIEICLSTTKDFILK